MKSNVFRLNAQLRTALGKKEVRRLRRFQDQIPAIVYGAGKAPMSIALSNKELTNALSHESTYSRILTLNVDSQGEEQVVLKQVQRHPSRPRLLHVDFLRIDPNIMLTMEIPVHLLGTELAPGIKEGGILSHHLTEVEIQCLPAHLPEYIELDVSKMALGDSLHLSNLALPAGVELAILVSDEENDQAVVSVIKPYVPTAAELASESAAPEAPVIKEEETSADTKE